MVYVVILTWNGLKYLPKFFKSLASLNYPSEKINFVVVDSCSVDGSVEFLENLNWPNLHLIKLEKNLGFVSGNNIGMQYALDQGAEYLVLLNQDIEVEPDFLFELVKVATSDKKIGAVQSLILYYQNRNEINCWGNELHYLGYGFSGGNHEKISNFKFSIFNHKEITYASGAAVLYKAGMLKKIGLLDENIGSYHEDSDICLRGRLCGYRTVLASGAIVYHDYYFPTTKNKNRYFLMEKNRLYIILKFYKLKTLLLIWPMLLFMDLGQLYFALKSGYFWQWLEVHFWFLINIKSWLKARKKIQVAREIDDVELTKNFVSQIKFQEVSNFLLDKIANPVMKFYWQQIKKFI